MQQVKDTKRAIVRIGYDGRVHKTFRGPLASERFENEVRVLRHLEERGCTIASDGMYRMHYMLTDREVHA